MTSETRPLSPEMQALREIERQRSELLSGLSIQAAYEKMASRAAEAVFAAKVAEGKVAALEAEIKKLKEPKPAEEPPAEQPAA